MYIIFQGVFQEPSVAIYNLFVMDSMSFPKTYVPVTCDLWTLTSKMRIMIHGYSSPLVKYFICEGGKVKA